MSADEYRGWFGRTARIRCPHSHLRPIYADEINHVGGWRLHCLDCGRYLDGPVATAGYRDDQNSAREGTQMIASTSPKDLHLYRATVKGVPDVIIGGPDDDGDYWLIGENIRDIGSDYASPKDIRDMRSLVVTDPYEEVPHRDAIHKAIVANCVRMRGHHELYNLDRPSGTNSGIYHCKWCPAEFGEI